MSDTLIKMYHFAKTCVIYVNLVQKAMLISLCTRAVCSCVFTVGATISMISNSVDHA